MQMRTIERIVNIIFDKRQLMQIYCTRALPCRPTWEYNSGSLNKAVVVYYGHCKQLTKQ